jgi:hypothetical protein
VLSWAVVFVHVVALAVWTGAVAFFSFVVAPRVFGGLPVEQAGAVMGLLFPAYYAVGHACGAVVVGTAALLWHWSRPGGRVWLVATGIAGVALALSLYAGLVIQPRASALRPQLHRADAPPVVREEFDALHRRAVQLNGAVLVGTLALGGLLAVRLAGSVSRPRRPARRPSGLQW